MAPAKLTDKQISILEACVRQGGTEHDWKHSPASVNALVRKGLVTTSMTGSFMNGGPYEYWIDITAAGREAIRAELKAESHE